MPVVVDQEEKEWETGRRTDHDALPIFIWFFLTDLDIIKNA